MIIRRNSKGPFALIRRGRHVWAPTQRFRNAGVSKRDRMNHFSSKEKGECEKTDLAKRTRQADTCQVSGTSAMSSEQRRGVVSTLWEKLEGGRMRLLATQTCYSEHATRIAQEYLRCAPTRDRGYASSAQRSGHCRKKRRAGLWSRSQVEFLRQRFGKTWSQRENMNVCPHGSRLAGGHRFKPSACCRPAFVHRSSNAELTSF